MAPKRKHAASPVASCSAGHSKGYSNKQEEYDSAEWDLRRKIETVRDHWVPSPAMASFMTALCNQLHLSVSEQTRGLTTHQQYSDKLAELKAQRDASNEAIADKITPAQYATLVRMGCKHDEINDLTKMSASDRITELIEERNQRPATQAQLKLLKNLGHKGTTPTTLCKASEIINQLRRWKKMQAFRRSAAAKGCSKEDIKEMEQYLATHAMWE